MRMRITLKGGYEIASDYSHDLDVVAHIKETRRVFPEVVKIEKKDFDSGRFVAVWKMEKKK